MVMLLEMLGASYCQHKAHRNHSDHSDLGGHSDHSGKAFTTPSYVYERNADYLGFSEKKCLRGTELYAELVASHYC